VWVRRRARRLLVPVLPLLALWVPSALLLGRAGVPEEEVALATQTAFLPVWFLAVYLLAIGLLPLTAGCTAASGSSPVVAGAVVLTGRDRRPPPGGGARGGFANYLVVWAGIHQLGYAWADDSLPRGRGAGLLVAGGGVVALVVLVGVAGYPLSVVATETGSRNNTDPPTLVLWALTAVQLGVLLAARPTLRRWLERPKVWGPVAVAGSVIITVFLWHMTALVLVAALTHPTGCGRRPTRSTPRGGRGGRSGSRSAPPSSRRSWPSSAASSSRRTPSPGTRGCGPPRGWSPR
jgi:hypothetical protein